MGPEIQQIALIQNTKARYFRECHQHRILLTNGPNRHLQSAKRIVNSCDFMFRSELKVCVDFFYLHKRFLVVVTRALNWRKIRLR